MWNRGITQLADVRLNMIEIVLVLLVIYGFEYDIAGCSLENAEKSRGKEMHL